MRWKELPPANNGWELYYTWRTVVVTKGKEKIYVKREYVWRKITSMQYLENYKSIEYKLLEDGLREFSEEKVESNEQVQST